MKKIAVIFPGLGYHTEKPLLYYGAKLLCQYGYEVVKVNYDEIDTTGIVSCIQNRKQISDKLFHDAVITFLSKALTETEKQLADYVLQDYEQILLLGKSIGTVVGNAFTKKFNLHPYNILVTPLEQCFQFMDDGEGIAFVGSQDPLINSEEIQKICGQKDIECHVFPQANHSLETGNVLVDIKALSTYVEQLADYIDFSNKGVYDFKVEGRNLETVDLGQFRGKVSLVVNTATGCGFTPQYEYLEDFYERYQAKGFTVLDFPCNQFNNQAPGTADEIHSFCTARYHVSFPQFAKICVNGEKAIDLYKFLKRKRGFHGFDLSTPDGKFMERKAKEDDENYENNSDIKWNFTKFLIDQEGNVIKRYEPTESMYAIQKDIEKLLGIESL